MGEDGRFSPQDRAVFAALRDGDGVLLDTQTTAYFGLNKTAAFLWEKLQEAREITAGQLADLLCGRFAVDRPTAERDVSDFLARVVKYGLATRVPAATSAGP
jgi:hypothetical protein